MATAIDHKIYPLLWQPTIGLLTFEDSQISCGGMQVTVTVQSDCYGCVIGKDRFGRQNVAADGISQRFQKCRGLADPVGQR